MEGIALDAGAFHCGIEESQVEGCVVADENRSPAAVRADGGADLAEQPLQRVTLRNGRPQRMPRIDAVDLERHRIESRALEGLHVKAMRRAAADATR